MKKNKKKLKSFFYKGVYRDFVQSALIFKIIKKAFVY